MREQYRMEVKEPMLHLAERNLLLAIFRERMMSYGENQKALREVKLILSRRREEWKHARVAFVMVMQSGENAEAEGQPKRLTRRYRIRLYQGWMFLTVQVRCAEELSEDEAGLMKILVADMAETLRLFANGDCFMKLGAEKLIAEIAAETGVVDPTIWTRKYLARPPYMERPEVRRYYRLYNNHLDHAKPQILLRRKVGELIETPV